MWFLVNLNSKQYLDMKTEKLKQYLIEISCKTGLEWVDGKRLRMIDEIFAEPETVVEAEQVVIKDCSHIHFQIPDELYKILPKTKEPSKKKQVINLDEFEKGIIKGKEDLKRTLLEKLNSLPETTGCIGLISNRWCCARHYGQNDVKDSLK